jgi:hypothetical protein
MRKFLTCAALLWLAAARAAGQGDGAGGASRDTPPSFVRLGDVDAEARRLLESGENRERAWGAYLAGLHGLRALAPRLVGLLADPTLDGGGREAGLVRQAALDALIRLRAEAPAETLMPLWQTSPDEVIILLARDPQQNGPALLSLFVEGTPRTHWLAAGNLLAQTRAPGFAARLMAELKMEAQVYVYDDDDDDHGVGGGSSGGCGYGCEASGVPDEYPPVFYYYLTTGGARDAVVIASGCHTIYYTRQTSPACGGSLDYGGGAPRDSYRVEYVADLLGTTEEELKLEPYTSHTVVCREEWPCRRALAAVRDEVVAGYTGAVSRLLDAGLLDPAEAAELKPDITLHLDDARGRRPFPLPSKLKGVKVEVFVPGAEPTPDPDEPATPETEQDSPG